MNKIFLILLTIFGLSACTTTTPQVQSVFDPNLSAAQSQLTAEAALSQSRLFSVMATGTAQAPIISITETGAAISFAMTENSIRATEIAALWTPTPSPLPTITLTATPNLTATVGVQAFLVQKDIDDKAAERREFNNGFWAWATPILFILFVAAFIIGGLTVIRILRHKQVERDENGKTKLILDNTTGEYVDLSANPNYRHMNESLLMQMFIQYMEKKYGFVPNMPRITDTRQDNVKEREQIIEIERIRRSRLPKALIDMQSMKFLPEPSDEAEQVDGEVYAELPLPSWVELNKWDGKLLPLGMDEQSKLMLVDTSHRPHLMYVGRSRSGKTLTGERTSVACLLTQGWNVIVMGKRVDWMPFEEHLNFKLLAVDVRKDAQKYIDILQILSAQMDIRDTLLASKHISTWDRYGAPSTMVVLDDYSGALIRMPKPKAAEVTAEVRNIAMDGAKFGLSLTIGLQDATAQNVDTTTRSQMARIVYSLENATKSRVALDAKGAERLPLFRHFLTRITDNSNVGRGVGFFLEDRQVEAFLASRPVQQNEQMEWVDCVIDDVPTSLPDQQPVYTLPASQTKYEWINGLDVKDAKLIEMYQAGGLSNAQMEEAAFGYTNGRTARRAKELIERYREYQGITTTTTTTTLNMPNLGAVAA